MPLLRPAALARPVLRPSTRALAASRRTFFSQKQSSGATQELDLNKLNARRREYEQHRIAFLSAGAAAGIIAFAYTAWKLKEALDHQAAKEKSKLAVKCDTSVPVDTFKTEAGERRKVVLHDDDGREIVPTGNSVVPTFPRTITVDEAGTQQPSYLAQSITTKQGVEYILVGLGMRTVTFLGFQVYLVGFYVATQDIARLQQYLIRKVNRLATTLIPSEKETLRAALLDPTQGEQTWDALLQDAGCRSLFRIMPVRDTDFHHLRDGFVRAVQARSQRDKAYGDEAFGAAMKEFKTMFNRGSVPKKKELLLCRDLEGRLTVLYGDDELARKPKRTVLGVVADERFSRLLWLNYLAGANVSSEPARQNIIEGVMEFVGRPVGTIASQVL